jgi:hypothetical protein
MLSAALLVASMAFAAFGQAPARTTPAQGAPPKNLSVRPDGHVSANQDPENPDKFEVRVVKQGDTLSAIAGDVLKDSRLWPQLWEQNEHIINPHWIYPNDKILIRPVTVLSEAKPPEPAAVTAPAPPPSEPPAPLAEVEVAPPPRPAPAAPPPPPPPAAAATVVLDERKPATEVKIEDLYCSGFVRTSPVPRDLKVIAKFGTPGGFTSAENDYVYLSQGSEDGIVAGNVYEVVRATKELTNPNRKTKAERDLGMHYLEIGNIQVTLTQPDFSIGKIIHTCGDAVEIGDIMIPFVPIVLPPRERPRPFSQLITTTSGIRGEIVSTKTVLLSYGSQFSNPAMATPGIGGNGIGVIDRGVAAAGTIVYLDIGQDKSVNPGDIFIVYRDVTFDKTLYPYPKEIEKLKGQRLAIGELIVVKVGERASTALVTYSSDALSLGDAVERR